MALDGVAKQALAQAIEAYNAVQRLVGAMDTLQSGIRDFREHARKTIDDSERRANDRASAFEARVAQQLQAYEARTELRLQSVEARLVLTESRMAKIEGSVQGALAKAYDDMVERDRAARSAGQALPPAPRSRPGNGE